MGGAGLGQLPVSANDRAAGEGDLLVLDLFSESRPQWGDSASTWRRKNGFGGHNWIYCMLLNFGGNVGLHGKMQHVIDEYYKACQSPFGQTLRGVGLTMEGAENNPVMYELLTELPWRPAHFSKDEWLTSYVRARYGRADSTLVAAWRLLGNSIYNCPVASTQQGTHESVFCARPSDAPYQVSSWAETSDYYQPADVWRAAQMMLSVADSFRTNNNFTYDLTDVVRQALAEKGRATMKVLTAAARARDKGLYRAAAERFLHLIMLQDELLATRPNSAWARGSAAPVPWAPMRPNATGWNGTRAYKSPRGATAPPPNRAACATMRTANGTACCVTFTPRAGAPGSTSGCSTGTSRTCRAPTFTPWTRPGRCNTSPTPPRLRATASVWRAACGPMPSATTEP